MRPRDGLLREVEADDPREVAWILFLFGYAPPMSAEDHLGAIVSLARAVARVNGDESGEESDTAAPV